MGTVLGYFEYIIHAIKQNPRLFRNYGSADPPSEVATGHLDIKDAQCAKKMMDVKFRVTSYRLWAPPAPQKCNFLQKLLNLQRRLELIWGSFFCVNDFFCAILSF